jgi:hypothetical protein
VEQDETGLDLGYDRRAKQPASEPAPGGDASAPAAPLPLEAAPAASRGQRVGRWPLGDLELPAPTRIAGVFLVLTGVLQGIQLFYFLAVEGPQRTAAFVAAMLDVVLGVALAGGNRRVVGWALARALLGAVFLGVTQPLERAAIGLQLLSLLGLLLLLLGEPGRWRMRAGTGLLGAVAAVLLLLVAPLVLPFAPLQGALLTVNGALEPGRVTAVQGDEASYQLTFPDSGWRQVPAARMPPGAHVDRMWVYPWRDRWWRWPWSGCLGRVAST